MATLIGPVPPGLTFQDLVGGPMTRTPPSRSVPALQDRKSTPDQPACERRLRIYLPEGAVREMTLTESQGFLVSYRINHIRPPVEAAHSDDGGSRMIKRRRGALPAPPALDHHDRDHIGQQLRAMYEQLLDEPVPGHLLTLIARLERQDRKPSDDR